MSARGGDLTFEKLVSACRNIGFDLTCPACAAIFYTGVGLPGDEHSPGCPTTEKVESSLGSTRGETMIEPKWLEIERDTWAMCVPGGVVMRYDDADGVAMVHVPATTVQDVGGRPYLVSTMADLMRMSVEMGAAAGEALEKKLR
jgi:hypothetical protein